MHLALFAYLARVMPVLRTPSYGPEPDVQVELARFPTIPLPEAQPRPARAVERHAPRSQLAPSVRPTPAPNRAPPARSIQARPQPVPPRAPVVAAAPAPPSTASASIPAQGGKTGQAVGGSGGARAPANYPGDEERDGVRTFLRATVGCSHEEYLHLNAAERANCDQRVGKDARAVANVTLDALPSGKRAYYDAVQQAYQAAHDPRTPVDTSAGGGSWTGQAGHGLGFGCKAGKCGVQLPSGVGTEEVGVPKP
jgi:hypothetical protein